MHALVSPVLSPVTVSPVLSPSGIQIPLGGIWIPPSGFRIPGIVFQSLSVEFGFWISIVSGPPDSLSCIPE